MTLSPRLVYWLCIPPLMVAFNAVTGRYLAGTVPPLWLNAARWTLVVVLAGPWVWRLLRQPEAWRRRGAYLAQLGFLGMVCFPGLQYLALQSSSALNVTLIAGSLPLSSMVVGAVGYRVRPSGPQLLGALLSVLGVWLVITQGTPSAWARIQPVPGDLLMLLATFAWAAYTWRVARPPAHMQGDQAPGWNWIEFVWPQVLLGLLCMWPLAAAEQFWTPVRVQWRWELVGAVLLLALGPSLYSYRCWALGVSRVGAPVMAFFANLAPLFAAVLGALWLGEWPSWYHGLAFACIVAGIALSRRG